MKAYKLPLVVLLLAASLATSAMAQVVVNGSPISLVVLNGVPVNNLSIVQQGGTLTISAETGVNPCEDPASESCPGSDTFCVINPVHVACPGSEAFCVANSAHLSCPGSEAYCSINTEDVSCPGSEAFCSDKPQHESCSENECTGEMPVFETINWTKLNAKTMVVTGKKGVSSKFTTSDSTTYAGNFGAVASSNSGNLTRRLWISKCPGGDPIVWKKTIRGVQTNTCDVSGSTPSLSWSQADFPQLNSQCKLERSATYYLNHKQAAFGTSAGPTATSSLFRSAGAANP